MPTPRAWAPRQRRAPDAIARARQERTQQQAQLRAEVVAAHRRAAATRAPLCWDGAFAQVRARSRVAPLCCTGMRRLRGTGSAPRCPCARLAVWSQAHGSSLQGAVLGVCRTVMRSFAGIGAVLGECRMHVCFGAAPALAKGYSTLTQCYRTLCWRRAWPAGCAPAHGAAAGGAGAAAGAGAAGGRV